MAYFLAGAHAYIEQQLLEDATLINLRQDRLWEGEAPEGSDEEPTEYPLQVYQHMAGSDILTVGVVKIYTNCLYLIKGVSRSGYTSVSRIASRTNELLHGANQVPITIDGVEFLVTSWQEREVIPPPATGGIRYYNAGAVYRFLITLAS